MNNRYKSRQPLGYGLAVIAAAAILLPSTARADVTGGDSKGFGIYVALTLIGVPILTVPEQPVSQGTAPGVYSDADQVLSLSASVPLIAGVGTAVMDTTADSDIDGSAGTRFAMSSSLVDDLEVTVLPSGIAPALLSLTADTVGSDSIVSGDFGSMSAVGTSVLENLVVSVSGVGLNVPLFPDPNTVLWNSLGLSIILNEQTSSVVAGNASIDTNAIHIQLVDIVTAGGLLSGDIIIAHSDAEMNSVVPEPATFVSLAGLSLLALTMRRRK